MSPCVTVVLWVFKWFASFVIWFDASLCEASVQNVKEPNLTPENPNVENISINCVSDISPPQVVQHKQILHLDLEGLSKLWIFLREENVMPMDASR